MMDLDDNYDMNLHPMNDFAIRDFTLPEIDPHEVEPEDDAVQWKASQTSNRALDSLMLEAQAQNAYAVRGTLGEWHLLPTGEDTILNSFVHCSSAEPMELGWVRWLSRRVGVDLTRKIGADAILQLRHYVCLQCHSVTVCSSFDQETHAGLAHAKQ